MKRVRRLVARPSLGRSAFSRPIDRIVVRGITVLLALFVVAAPLLSVSGGAWAERAVTTEQQAQHTWHLVSAELTKRAPVQSDFSNGILSGSWLTARWIYHGEARTRLIPDPAGSSAATGLSLPHRIRIWVNAAGRWTGPPLSSGLAQIRVAAAMLAPPLALAFVLAITAFVLRHLVNRRRLTSWDHAWALVGPQWTREFRARD
jgi:hypothetical protein